MSAVRRPRLLKIATFSVKDSVKTLFQHVCPTDCSVRQRKDMHFLNNTQADEVLPLSLNINKLDSNG